MIVPIFLRFYRRLRIKAAGEAVQKEVEEKDYHRLTNRAEKAVIEHDEMMAAGNKILQMRGKPGNMEEDSKQQHKSEKQHWVPDFLPQPAEKHGTKTDAITRTRSRSIEGRENRVRKKKPRSPKRKATIAGSQRISRGRAARGPNRLPVCRSRPRIRAWTKEAARI